MNDCEKGAIGLSLLIILFMGSTVYFAYWAHRLREMLLREQDRKQ